MRLLSGILTSWLLMASLFFASGIALAADNHCALRFAWVDLPPYQFPGPDGAIKGIDHDLVTEAARRAGCVVTWISAPRPRALMMVQEGQVDAIAGVAHTPEREKIGIYSHFMRQGRNVLVLRREDAGRYFFSDLAGLAASPFRLGVVSGSLYSSEYERLLRSGDLADNLVIVNGGESATTMLLRGRIDGFLDGYRVAAERLERMGVRDQVVFHPMKITSKEAFILFSRAAGIDPAIIDRFNLALAAMQEDGTTARILDLGGS